MELRDSLLRNSAISQFRISAIDQIGGKVQRPPNVTDRAAGLEGYEGAGHGGMIAAVALIDILDHLLAAQGVEVDVDVGQAGALLGEKTLENQIVRQRVDRGDLQQVGHQRVGGRAAALATDTLRAGKAHDVPDDQEVVGQPKPADHGQLVVQRAAGALTRLRAKTPDQCGLAQPAQVDGLFFVACEGRGNGELRQILHAMMQRDVTPGGDLQRVRERVGPVGEEAGHFGGAFEMRLTVAAALMMAFFERGQVADGYQHIMETMSVARGIVDVVSGDHRQVLAFGQGQQGLHQPLVAGPALALQLDKESAPARKSHGCAGLSPEPLRSAPPTDAALSDSACHRTRRSIRRGGQSGRPR